MVKKHLAGCRCLNCASDTRSRPFYATTNQPTRRRLTSSPSLNRVQSANAVLSRAAYSELETFTVDDKRRDQLRRRLMKKSPVQPLSDQASPSVLGIGNLYKSKFRPALELDSRLALQDRVHPDIIPPDGLEYGPYWPKSKEWPGHPDFGYGFDGIPLGQSYILYNNGRVARSASQKSGQDTQALSSVSKTLDWTDPSRWTLEFINEDKVANARTNYRSDERMEENRRKRIVRAKSKPVVKTSASIN